MTWLWVGGLLLMSSSPDSALARAGPAAETWAGVLTAMSGQHREWAQFLLNELSVLDLMEADSAGVTNHVLLTSASRSFHRTYALPEDTLRRFLLWPLTGHRDHLSDWRPGLQAALVASIQDTPAATAESVLAVVGREVAVADSGDLFGPPSPPLATYLRGWGTAAEVASLSVAALRSLGVAARLAPEASGAEYWDGARWVRAANREATGQVSENATCTIELVLTLGGRPFVKPESAGLSRREDDRWKELWPPEFPMQTSETDTSLLLRVPPGDYLVTAGVRNATGEPRIWCRAATVTSGQTLVLRQALDIPFEELCRTDLVRGSVEDLSILTFEDPEGRAWAADDVLDAGTLVLVLLDLRSESSKRVAAGFEDAMDELTAAGAQLHMVAVGQKDLDLRDPEGAAATALGMKKAADGTWSGLPVVLVLSESGELLMWRSGYDLTLPHLALQVVLAGQGQPQHQ